MAKSPQDQAREIADQTFTKEWGRKKADRSVEGMLLRSEGGKISHLHRFRHVPIDDIKEFEAMIEKVLQTRLNSVYQGALKAHVWIRYPEPQEMPVDTVFGTSSWHAVTGWYVTRP